MNRYLLPLLALLGGLLLPAAGAGAQEGEEPAAPTQADLDYYAFDLDYINDAGGLSFRELAESDKPFVLVWWLTDCQLCRMQMPYVQELYNTIRDNELDLYLVSVNINDRERDCRSYMAETGLTVPVLWDMHGRRTEKAYGLKDLGTPLTYVFGPGGEFIDTLSGYKAGYMKTVLGMLDIEVPEKKK